VRTNRLERAFRHETLSRRAFLRRVGRSGLLVGSAISLPAILAACGIGSSAPPKASLPPSSSGNIGPRATGTLSFANRPLSIDPRDGSHAGTIADYEAATDSTVTYTEAITDEAAFFGRIQPVLAAGRDTGYDLIVAPDWRVARLASLTYLEPIDVGVNVPNFGAHAAQRYRNPGFDPGNAHSVPWRSDMVGIAFNPSLTKREITSFSDLLDPAFKGRIGMLADMRDTLNLTLLGMGVKLAAATIENLKSAQAKLLAQRPLVRAYYDGSYVDALAGGDLAISVAHSADVFQLQFDNPDLRFVLPAEGGLLRVDNLVVPAHARHPVDAQQMMNFVYRPEIAAQITEYVNPVCPVPEARDIIRQHARDAAGEGDSEAADYLNKVAASTLVFPTDATLAKAFSPKDLSEEEEAQWNDLFQAVVHG
jgi:spermidine/putrescine transport system substrate-binding protein